ncbi:MAG TPA: Flp pilus assembly protein CpaB [Caulobacteraceae bacterium]|nr:Flp pilus assembly protein CpaB [Caulobacteraceae bacterium]
MRLGTVISLGASTVLGVGALLVARLWLPSHGGPHPSTAQAAAPHIETMPVVVAAKEIPWGVKLNADYLKVTQLPDAAMPQGAFHSVGQILNQDGGAPVALTAMSPQEPVLTTKISGPGERQTLAALVDPTMRAYTISVTASTAGGGHIMPGDRVDVLYSRELPVPTSFQQKWGNAKVIGATAVLQDIRVLGMDLNANPTSTQPAIPSTATLEVSMEDAERLALAIQGGGTLSLALRRPGSTEIEPLHRFVLNGPGADSARGGMGPQDLNGGGEAGAAARAPKTDHHRSSNKPASAHDSAASVIITSGAARTSITVPAEGGL